MADQANGKGRATPKAPQNRRRRAAGTGLAIVAFVKSVLPTPGAHPEIEDELLDLRWESLEGAAIVTRFPRRAWPSIREQIDEVYTALEENPSISAQAKRAGIHLPGGVDVETEAEALDEIREGKGIDGQPD